MHRLLGALHSTGVAIKFQMTFVRKVLFRTLCLSSQITELKTLSSPEPHSDR